MRVKCLAQEHNTIGTLSDADMTPDKKLGLEWFQVLVATKQTLLALICQMQIAEIILQSCKTCIDKARNCDF